MISYFAECEWRLAMLLGAFEVPVISDIPEGFRYVIKL
jgi:hypothetical protein